MKWKTMVDKLFARGGKSGQPGEVKVGKNGHGGSDKPDFYPWGEDKKVDVTFIGDETRRKRKK